MAPIGGKFISSRFPDSMAWFAMPANGAPGSAQPTNITFRPNSNDPEDAKVPLIRTTFTFGTGGAARVSQARIKGAKIKLLDSSGAEIPEGSNTVGKDFELQNGFFYRGHYNFGFQNWSNGEYVDIGLMDADLFEAQVIASDPGPHAAGLLNYQADGTGENDNTGTLRLLAGDFYLDLSGETSPKKLCLGAYNADGGSNTTKGIAWWHMSLFIYEVMV